MSRPVLDFFFDFASTYSYPAAMRIGERADAAGVAVRWRPLLLGPIFRAQGWEDSPFNRHPAKGRYMWRDLARICDRLGLGFCRPDPFPQPSLLAARLAHVGLDEGWGEDFCRGVFAVQFARGGQIGDEAVMRGLLGDLGVVPAAALDRARSDPIKERLRATTAEAEQRGVFGAPTFITADGEVFWGHDRMAEALAWTVRPHGAAYEARWANDEG